MATEMSVPSSFDPEDFDHMSVEDIDYTIEKLERLRNNWLRAVSVQSASNFRGKGHCTCNGDSLCHLDPANATTHFWDTNDQIGSLFQSLPEEDSLNLRNTYWDEVEPFLNDLVLNQGDEVVEEKRKIVCRFMENLVELARRSLCPTVEHDETAGYTRPSTETE